jgi:hypothetical protein
MNVRNWAGPFTKPNGHPKPDGFECQISPAGAGRPKTRPIAIPRAKVGGMIHSVVYTKYDNITIIQKMFLITLRNVLHTPIDQCTALSPLYRTFQKAMCHPFNRRGHLLIFYYKSDSCSYLILFIIIYLLQP